MPQLVKGGKYVFGWSRIMSNGLIVIPAEATKEYKLKRGMNVILMSGSKTSGGIVIAAESLFRRSAIGGVLAKNQDFSSSHNEDGKIIEYKQKNVDGPRYEL